MRVVSRGVEDVTLLAEVQNLGISPVRDAREGRQEECSPLGLTPEGFILPWAKIAQADRNLQKQGKTRTLKM